MQDLPLFEQVARQVASGHLPPDEIKLQTDKLRERLDAIETVSEESLSACLRSLEALLEDPTPARGRELDVACRMVSRSMMRTGADNAAWPSLSTLVQRLEESPAESIDFTLQIRLEREIGSISRFCERPVYLEAWRQGLLDLAQTLQAVLAGHLSHQEGANQLRDLTPRLDQLWAEEIAASYTSGPTRWPALNAVIQVGRAFQESQALGANLNVVINGLLDSVDTMDRSSQELVQMQGGAQGTATSAQLAFSLREKLHALSQASLTVLTHLDDGLDLAPIWPAYEEAGVHADQAIQTFMAATENIGKTPCIRCGAPNPSDRSHCLRCNAILPRDLQTAEGLSLAEQEEGSGQMAEGGYLAPLLLAIDEAILDPEGLETLDGLLISYEEHFLEAAGAKVPEGVTGDVYAEVMRLTGEGIETLKDGSVECLHEGRRLLLEAHELAKALLQTANPS